MRKELDASAFHVTVGVADEMTVRKENGNRQSEGATDWHRALHEQFAEPVKSLYGALDEPLRVAVRVTGLTRRLVQHLTLEEDVVLPLYRRHVASPPPPATPQQFVEDHRLIRSCLDELRGLALQASFKPLDPSFLRHALVAFDELLEHHDQREMKYLYPALSEALEPAEWQELQEQFGTLVHAENPESVERILKDPCFRDLCDRYRRWLEFRDDLPSPAKREAACSETVSEPVLIPPIRRPAVLKLLQRDTRLIQSLDRSLPSSTRQFALDERRVDQTLRSTIHFVLDHSWSE